MFDRVLKYKLLKAAKGGDGMDKKIKYDYKQYDFPISDGMKAVQDVYNKYILDEDNKKLYDQLKEAIYMLSLDIKSERVCGNISPADADDMKEYFWSLLL